MASNNRKPDHSDWFRPNIVIFRHGSRVDITAAVQTDRFGRAMQAAPQGGSRVDAIDLPLHNIRKADSMPCLGAFMSGRSS